MRNGRRLKLPDEQKRRNWQTLIMPFSTSAEPCRELPDDDAPKLVRQSRFQYILAEFSFVCFLCYGQEVRTFAEK